MTKLRSGIDLVKVSRLAKAYENFGLDFCTEFTTILKSNNFKKNLLELNLSFWQKTLQVKKLYQKSVGMASPMASGQKTL